MTSSAPSVPERSERQALAAAGHSDQRLVRPVAVLCANSVTAYRGLPGVEVYDKKRDARTFRGGVPVIAHPPCRSWSAWCGHQAKPEPGERELALWCVEQVNNCGGILEQPAHSRLWDTARLPKPGTPYQNGRFCVSVWQAWWGYPMKKATWLYLVGIEPADVRTPYRLHPAGGDRRREQLMSKQQRSRTEPAFAAWLVALARTVGTNSYSTK